MNKGSNKNNLIYKILMRFNILFVLCLILSYSAYYINPITLWIIPFFGLAYPFILAANIFFIILWILLKWRNALLSFIFIIIGYSHFDRLVQFSGEDIPKDTSHIFKVISYNVRLFDLYGETNKNKQSGKDEIFSFLQKEQPDIACFQEYYYGTKLQYKTTDSLLLLLNAKNHFEYFPRKIKDKECFGISIYSKFPIINSGVIPFKTQTTNSTIFVDLQIKNKIIRVYNAHLQSIRFGKEDYVFADKINNNELDKNIKNSSQKLYSKLKKAYKIRAEQAIELKQHLNSSPYPVILCGDFNDTPVSYTYQTLSKNLTDCYTESGKGIGTTYSGSMPSFRIDYIFHDKAFKSYLFTTHSKIKASDHYPISARIKIGGK